MINIMFSEECATHSDVQELSAKINRSVEQQMVNAASAGKLTIMKNIVQPEAYVKSALRLAYC